MRLLSRCTSAIQLLLVVLSFPSFGIGQSLYVQQGTKHQAFIERLEIILQKNTELNIYTPSSIPRSLAVQIAGLEDSSSGNPSVKLSKVDQKNLLSFLRNNAEYVTWDLRRKHILYRNWANFFEINKDNFYLNLNPVGLAQTTFDAEDRDPVYHAAGGASLRGLIGKKFGFYSYFTKHAESAPGFVRKRINEFNAVPGSGYYETYKQRRGFVYYDARGGVSFDASTHFNAEIAFDRNFIGNGYRSLILSDYGYNYLYLKTNIYIWKFKYQHLYAKLAEPFSTGASREKWPYGEKVMYMHHLSINPLKWLNVGIFQSLITDEEAKWHYINPIMFFPRTGYQKRHPADKDITGLDFRANVAKRAQFYGQFLFDNFKIKEVTNGNGWWNNRFGIQLGAKYIDVFNVKNLDLQVEMNSVRPYTYSANDTVSNYSHYNQPLAHPLGANFREWIGILRYQPHRRVTLYTRVIYWNQGFDTSKAENFGADIFKPYTTRPYDYNVDIGNGHKGTGLNAQFQFSYEVAENIFFDAIFMLRKIKLEKNIIPEDNTNLLSAGIRLNIFKRDYDF
ncbi:MAG: hypothetical protein JNK79_12100 [Chitinophagaceae bacterium]|nr:hypothetical protein [Chitinophagaceae bacterium]